MLAIILLSRTSQDRLVLSTIQFFPSRIKASFGRKKQYKVLLNVCRSFGETLFPWPPNFQAHSVASELFSYRRLVAQKLHTAAMYQDTVVV